MNYIVVVILIRVYCEKAESSVLMTACKKYSLFLSVRNKRNDH